MLMRHLPGEQRTYYSVDSAFDDAGEPAQEATSEFLQTVDVPGLPSSKVHRCARDADAQYEPPRRSCNGTRLVITRLGRKVIEGRILTLCLPSPVSSRGL